MKKERLKQTIQKYKGLQETIVNNYMAIKQITWKKWTESFKKVQSSMTEKGRNKNYEQPTYKL